MPSLIAGTLLVEHINLYGYLWLCQVHNKCPRVVYVAVLCCGCCDYYYYPVLLNHWAASGAAGPGKVQTNSKSCKKERVTLTFPVQSRDLVASDNAVSVTRFNEPLAFDDELVRS